MALDAATMIERVGAGVVRVAGGRRHSGSGVVWAADRVVTASHVVPAHEARVWVDGEARVAKVKGRDPSTDLVLLEVEGGGLSAPAFDEGGSLKVGQSAFHLARPGETVRATHGILSVVGQRPVSTPYGGELARWLEADAASPPGFSGGALVDDEGRVLGLLTEGLFRGSTVAVPTPTLQRVVAQLEAHGRPRRSWLGASLQPLQLPENVKVATGEELGLLVVGLEPAGPAEKAGLEFGDTVLHLGDDSVRTLDDLYAYLRADHVGSTVPVKLYRRGAVETKQVTLGARP